MNILKCRAWVSKYADANMKKVLINSFTAANEFHFRKLSADIRKIHEKHYKIQFPYLYIVAHTHKAQ